MKIKISFIHAQMNFYSSVYLQSRIENKFKVCETCLFCIQPHGFASEFTQLIHVDAFMGCVVNIIFQSLNHRQID